MRVRRMLPKILRGTACPAGTHQRSRLEEVFILDDVD